jgi:tetratricopeptide (TPR) repeat protein
MTASSETLGFLFKKKDWRTIVIVTLAAVILCGLALSTRAGRNAYENITFFLAPSSERAFAYGTNHLDYASADSYDIDRAQYWYGKVAVSDPNYHYLNHQLARIQFLHGNFNTALFYINKQIALEGTSTPNSYYIRGLIEGYMGRYDDAVKDYAYFVSKDPHDWAALNDYTWVLLKAQRYREADKVTAQALTQFPNNPWLLNSRATALYELHDYAEAYKTAKQASDAVQKVTTAEWSHSYPGNDPKVASEGLASFKKAIADNIHTIQTALASSTVQ